jgi:hypothetical protein
MGKPHGLPISLRISRDGYSVASLLIGKRPSRCGQFERKLSSLAGFRDAAATRYSQLYRVLAWPSAPPPPLPFFTSLYVLHAEGAGHLQCGTGDRGYDSVTAGDSQWTISSLQKSASEARSELP